MAKVIWLDEALAQIDAIIAYIELFDPLAAQRFAIRLVSLGESLAEFPERGRMAARGVREMTTVPPYVLSYKVENDTVRILGVRHGARRPLD